MFAFCCSIRQNVWEILLLVTVHLDLCPSLCSLAIYEQCNYSHHSNSILSEGHGVRKSRSTERSRSGHIREANFCHFVSCNVRVFNTNFTRCFTHFIYDVCRRHGISQGFCRLLFVLQYWPEVVLHELWYQLLHVRPLRKEVQKRSRSAV